MSSNKNELPIGFEDEGIFTSWTDRPTVLPTRPELVEVMPEQNSNRRVITKWAIGGLAAAATGVAVGGLLVAPHLHQRSRFA